MAGMTRGSLSFTVSLYPLHRYVVDGRIWLKCVLMLNDRIPLSFQHIPTYEWN